MGLSVSGSLAVIILATFMMLAAVYPAASNVSETINDARSNKGEIHANQADTGINITRISYEPATDEVNLTVENTGNTLLHVDATSILVDNEYQTESHIASTVVDGDSSTNLWHPGDRLTVVTVVSEKNPTAVVVISEYDVSDREEF